jgi:hypothetical protein
MMTYTEAHSALTEIKALLERDDYFKTSYTTVWAAIANKVEKLSQAEQGKAEIHDALDRTA